MPVDTQCGPAMIATAPQPLLLRPSRSTLPIHPPSPLLAEVDVGRKNRKRKSGSKRKTRGALSDGRAPKTFQRLLDEVRREAAH